MCSPCCPVCDMRKIHFPGGLLLEETEKTVHEASGKHCSGKGTMWVFYEVIYLKPKEAQLPVKYI